MTTLVPERRKGNLPAEVTSFIGRRRELSQVRDALERYRLVILRGVGGVGKTRLATLMAHRLGVGDPGRLIDQPRRVSSLTTPGQPELTTPGQPQPAPRRPSPKRPAALAKLVAIFFD